MNWIPANLSNYCIHETTSSTCHSSTFMFLALIANLLQCSIDSNFVENSHLPEIDFIIVGGGTAGSVLANRLTEINAWNVLVLEAGIEEPKVTQVPAFTPMFAGSNIVKGFKSQNDEKSCKLDGCPIIVGSTMGGSSAINGMGYMRGHPEDYNRWAQMGNLGWSYDQLLPYFKKSEDNRDQDIVDENPGYHSTGGYQSVQRLAYSDSNVDILTNAFKELGYQVKDTNAREQIGIAITQWTVKDAVRQSANAAFVRSVRDKRANLFIRTQSYVTKIITDSKTKTAIGVEYKSHRDGSSIIVRAKKEVILSAGAIWSPKILMVSGIGPSSELEKHNITMVKELPVGENFQDHVTMNKFIVTLTNKTWTMSNYTQMVKDFNNYLECQNGPLSSLGVRLWSVFVKTIHEPNETAPDILFMAAPLSLRDILSDSKTPSFRPTAYYDAMAITPFLLTPKSRGCLKLHDTDPIWGNPKVYTGFFSNESDLDVAVAGIRIGLKLLNTTAFLENGYKLLALDLPPCKQTIYDSDNYWKCVLLHYTDHFYHFAGTCKMGPEEEDAVVDSRLRVHGVNGLRVVDASIMPIIPRGSIMAPTIMIAEKASDMIKEDWIK